MGETPDLKGVEDGKKRLDEAFRLYRVLETRRLHAMARLVVWQRRAAGLDDADTMKWKPESYEKRVNHWKEREMKLHDQAFQQKQVVTHLRKKLAWVGEQIEAALPV